MHIPPKFQATVRYLAKLDYLEKQHQVLRLDEAFSADHPDVKLAHEQRDEAHELFELVDPVEAERLRTMQPRVAA
jgi:hypothetical protein